MSPDYVGGTLLFKLSTLSATRHCCSIGLVKDGLFPALGPTVHCKPEWPIIDGSLETVERTETEQNGRVETSDMELMVSDEVVTRHSHGHGGRQQSVRIHRSLWKPSHRKQLIGVATEL